MGGLYLEGLIHGGAYFRNFTGIGLGKFLFGNCTLLLFFFLLVTETSKTELTLVNSM